MERYSHIQSKPFQHRVRISLAILCITGLIRRRFRPSSHDFKVDITHEQKALVGEDYPLLITVHNHDTRSLNITMDILLQPAENETGKR